MCCHFYTTCDDSSLSSCTLLHHFAPCSCLYSCMLLQGVLWCQQSVGFQSANLMAAAYGTCKTYICYSSFQAAVLEPTGSALRMCCLQARVLHCSAPCTVQPRLYAGNLQHSTNKEHTAHMSRARLWCSKWWRSRRPAGGWLLPRERRLLLQATGAP